MQYIILYINNNNLMPELCFTCKAASATDWLLHNQFLLLGATTSGAECTHFGGRHLSIIPIIDDSANLVSAQPPAKETCTVSTQNSQLPVKATVTHTLFPC